jgi:hypothetical protein
MFAATAFISLSKFPTRISVKFPVIQSIYMSRLSQKGITQHVGFGLYIFSPWPDQSLFRIVEKKLILIFVTPWNVSFFNYIKMN